MAHRQARGRGARWIPDPAWGSGAHVMLAFGSCEAALRDPLAGSASSLVFGNPLLIVDPLVAHGLRMGCAPAIGQRIEQVVRAKFQMRGMVLDRLGHPQTIGCSDLRFANGHGDVDDTRQASWESLDVVSICSVPTPSVCSIPNCPRSQVTASSNNSCGGSV